MDDLRILRVEIVERVKQLVRPGQHLIDGKWSPSPRHHLRQIIAGDKLHYEKLAISFGKMVTHARQRRMMQTREQTCLALELFAQTFVGKQRLFEGHGRV